MFTKHMRGPVFAVVVLAVAGATEAATIDVGDHTLNADSGGQTIQIDIVDGGQQVDGSNLLAEIGGGTVGPIFESVDLRTDTIFGQSATQGAQPGNTDRFVEFAVNTEEGNPVTLPESPELYATITIDTSGLTDGRYALKLGDINVAGTTADTDLTLDGVDTVPTITNGSIAIGDTPTVTWTGAGENNSVSTGANWDGFASPREGDAIVFAGGTQTTVDNDAADGATIDSLTFDSTADAFTINGNGFTLADGGAVTNNSGNGQTLNIDLDADGGMTIDAANGGFTFGGGNFITVENGESVTFTGSNNFTVNGGLSGQGEVLKNGDGTLLLNGGDGSFSGPITINSGVLEVGPNQALGTPSQINLGTATLHNNTGGGLNLGAPVEFTGDPTLDSGDGTELSIGGDVDLGGATRDLTVANNSEGALTTIEGAISNGGLNVAGASGTGEEILGLAGNNTYSGGTTLEDITVGVASDNAFGSGAVDVNGAVAVAASGAARDIGNAINLNSTLVITEDSASPQGLTLSGDVTLNSDSTLDVNSSAATTLSGAVGLGSNTLTANVEGDAGATEISGTISGGGDLNKTGDGTLAVSGSSGSYAGDLDVDAGTVDLTGTTGGGANVAGGSTLNVDGGTLGGNATVDGGTMIIDNSGSVGGDATVEGGSLSLDNSSVNGAATINGGSVTLSNGGSLGGTTVNAGGTLNGAGSVGSLDSVGGTISPGNSIGTITVNGDANLDLDTVLDLEVSVDGGTSSDLIDVSGTATLSDGLGLNIAQSGSGSFTGGETFTVLEAEGGLTADPSSLNINSSLDDVAFNPQVSGDQLQLTAELLNFATWDGGADPDGNWSANANWEDDEGPENGDRLIFAGETNLDTNNDLAEFATAAAITFEETAGGFTLGGNGVALEDGASVTNASSSTQTIDLDLTANGSLTLDAASGNLDINGDVALGEQDLTVTGANDTTVGGVVSGIGGLVKNGDGTLTLTNDNTYVGATTVDGGELDIQGSIDSDVTLNTGRLTLGNGSAIGLANTLTVNGGTLTASGVTIGNVMAVGGDFTVDGEDTLTLNGPVGLGAADRTVTVSGGGTGLTLGGDVSGDAALNKAGDGSLTLAGSNSFNALNVTGGTVTLNGGSALADDAALTLADTAGVSATLGADETIGTLSGGGSNGGNIDLNPNTLTVNQATDATFAGEISSSGGGGSLVKQGEGSLTLSGANTYDGGTTVNAGTLGIANDEAIGAGTLTMNGGNIAAVGGAHTLDEAVEIESDFAIEDGGGALNLAGSIDLGGTNRTITLNDPDGTVLSGDIADGGLTLNGAEGGSAVVLSGNNTFAGGATLDTLTVGLGSDSALGDGGTVSLSDTTLVAIGAARTIDEPIALDGNVTIAEDAAGAQDLTLAGDVTVNGDQTLTVLSTASNAITGGVDLQANNLTFAMQEDLTVSGTIGDDGADGGSIQKIGDAVLTLSGANTYGGGTALGGGTLALGDDAALGTGTLTVNAGVVRASGGPVTISNDVQVNGSFEIAGSEDFEIAGGGETIDFGDLEGNTRSVTISNTGTTTWSTTVSASNGVIRKNGDGGLVLSGDNDSAFAANFLIDAGSVTAQNGNALGDGSIVEISSGATLGVEADEVTGALSGGGTVELNGNTLTTAAGVSTSFSGDINGGTFEKGGDGDMLLSGTVDGLTVSGGSLVLNNSEDNAIDDTTVVEVNATLSLGNSETVAGLTDDGTGSGTVTLGSDNILTLEVDQGDQTYTGAITGSGGLTKTGADTQTLDGDSNDYTGTTRVEQGTLVLQGGGAIGDSSDVAVISQDTLELSDAGEAGANSETVGSLAGGGTVQLNDNTLTLAGSSEATFSGTLTDGGDGGSLVVNLGEGGVQGFSGTLDFTGGLDVQAGTVVFDDEMSVPGPVSNAGLLSGNYTIEGSLTNEDGGTVSPGNSIGTTTVNGNYTQGEGSTLAVEVEGSGDGDDPRADLLDVNAGNGEDGSATFESGSTIAVSLLEDGDDVEDDDVFDIVDAEGGIITPEGGLSEITVAEEFALIDFTLQLNEDEDLLQLLAEVANFLELANSFGANEDQTAVAAALNSLAQEDSDNPLIDGIEDSVDNGDQFLNALDQSSPQAYEPLRMITVENARLFTAALGQYFAARRAGSPALAMQGEVSPNRAPMLASRSADPALLASAMEGNGGGSEGSGSGAGKPRFGQGSGDGLPRFGDSGWSVFGRGIGVFQDQDTEGDRLGYNADAGGGLFGIDRPFTPNLTAGLSMGYIQTNADLAANRGEHDIDTVRVGPYMSYSPGPWFVDASLTYGYHGFESERTNPAGEAESEHDGHDFSAYGRAGYDFQIFGTGLTLTPEGALQYLYLYEEGFTESGAGALDVDGHDANSLRSRLGVSMTYPFQSSAITLIPELYVGWEHEFLGDDEEIDASFVGGGNGFSVGVAEPQEDSAVFAAGLSALLSEDLSAYVRYDGNYYSEGATHAVGGGIRLDF